MGIMPSEFYDMEQSDFVLMLKGWERQQEREEMIARKQTELIAEAFIGDGKGVKFVRESWVIGNKAPVEINDKQQALIDRLSKTKRKSKNNG